ncbi:MAG: UpxY family transcription antiterminator [Balneolaceae bacterium]|nr:MAG: UpxY family transcription antiterminator [Balneolaceae bacterium]
MFSCKVNDQKNKADQNRIWRAFYTRPRHEKKAADRLEDEFEVYCPVVETRVQWSDRVKKVKKPLFTGYLFARVNEKERMILLEDPSVSRTVTWLGKPAVIKDEEIRDIKILLEEIKPDDVEIQTFEEGQRVRIDSGSLREMEGIIVEVKGKKARLRLETMKCDVTFTVRTIQLKKVKQRTAP